MKAKSILKPFIYLGFCLLTVSDTFSQNPTENLAFKLLEREASRYEKNLSGELSRGIAKYLSQEFFNVSVRIYWNPKKIKELEIDPPNPDLPAKRKLPGFPIFIASEDLDDGVKNFPGIDNVMKIQVNVLLDESLPESHDEFIKGFVPTQARFVPERGDFLKITRLPFPKKIHRNVPDPTHDFSFPVVENEMRAVAYRNPSFRENTDREPVIIHPLVQKYVQEYKDYLKDRISAILVKYISQEDFALKVGINWSEDGLAQLQKTLFLDEYRNKVKLPGFKLYLEDQKQTFDILTNSSSLMKLEMEVLLNQKLGGQTARFVEKVILLSNTFSAKRGDRLKVYLDVFPEPVPNFSRAPRDISEDGMIDGEELVEAASELEKQNPAKHKFVNTSPELDAKTSIILLKAREYYHNDKLNLALEKVLEAIKINPDSHKAYEMLGSIYYRLNWTELALKNWRKSLELNPENEKLEEYLNRVEGDQTVINIQR